MNLPLLGFGPEVFRERRREVLSRLGHGAMLLPASPVLHRSGDSELPYRPDSELFYLSGFREPDALLVMRGWPEEERSVLFVRPRDPAAERWGGPRMGPEGAAELTGIADVHPLSELGERLPGLLKGARRLHFRLGIHPRVEGAVVDALRQARATGAKDGSGPRGVVDPGEILDELRLRKHPSEVTALREAAHVTARSFATALGEVRPGMGEWEVQARVEAEFRRQGAMGPAFATIAGSGENSCILHYVENGRKMEAGDLLLLDAGAEVRMYAGDITRVVPVGGAFSPPQRDIYAAVNRARVAVITAARPGVSLQHLHRLACRVLLEALVDLGVLTGSVEELEAAEAYRPFFPHRTSHWLGLDTHDVGDYVVDGEERPLEPGMVFTVEPGLYFPRGHDMETAPGAGPFLGIGVRLEDDVLVTPDGCEVLTASLPVDPDEVELLAAG